MLFFKKSALSRTLQVKNTYVHTQTHSFKQTIVVADIRMD